ncbi:hypothetical protein ERJ75_001378100 [Trypanosoma vivax]|nr:hypothetical protein ERJ75_001378100 [Trypanosoma vivax]
MSRRKAEPAVPKSHGQGRSAGAAWTVSRICWRNPAFSLTACRDGGSERRTQQDASIFRHDGLRGHASREARCGVHSQGLAQNGGTKRATRSMATRQAQWCLAARSRVRRGPAREADNSGAWLLPPSRRARAPVICART